jgi:hypothetical protein
MSAVTWQPESSAAVNDDLLTPNIGPIVSFSSSWVHNESW